MASIKQFRPRRPIQLINTYLLRPRPRPLRLATPLFIVHDSVARLSSHIAKDFFLSLKLWESAHNFEIYPLE